MCVCGYLVRWKVTAVVAVLSATIVSATVQVFFIKRVSTFSQHAPAFLVPTLIAWIGSIVSAIWVVRLHVELQGRWSHSAQTIVFPEDWAARSHSFVAAGRVAPAFTLACDVLVTAFGAPLPATPLPELTSCTAMWYLLQVRLTFPAESPVFRIIRVMLESATPPCITALLNVVFDDQAAGGFVFLVRAAPVLPSPVI